MVETKKSAVGYIRVSTTHQAQNGISLENQKKRIRDYCEYKGYELLEIIEDAGVSGGINSGRDGWTTLLDRIKEETIDVLIIYSLERLSRNFYTLVNIEKLLSELGTELHTIDGQISTETIDGFATFVMKALFSEIERRQISLRTIKAMEHKKSQGMVIGKTPYGFERNGKLLVKNKEEQTVIRLANDLYKNGYRLVDIVNELNKEGFINRAGNKWASAQIRNLIVNYQGKFTKRKKGNKRLLFQNCQTNWA